MITAASASSRSDDSWRPPSANAVAASRRFFTSVESTETTSSSVSCLATLPATSAFVMAASTILSVADRTSSRPLMAAVRSVRRRSLRLTGPLWHRDRVSLSRILGATVGGGVAAGAALTAYGYWEARQYGLRHEVVPILPSGAHDIRVLHISDLHLLPSQRAKLDWVSMLADLGPDLVIDTGDNLAHRDSVGPLLESFGSLLDAPGVFVNGSNDYFEPTPRNPLRYLTPDDGVRYVDGPQL